MTWSLLESVVSEGLMRGGCSFSMVLGFLESRVSLVIAVWIWFVSVVLDVFGGICWSACE